MIHLLRQRATRVEIEQMASTLGGYVKLAVDIQRSILAGGGELHADCEDLLLEDGSRQVDIWGANWIPETGEVTFEALINIRPRQENRSMEIEDLRVRGEVDRIARELLEVD